MAADLVVSDDLADEVAGVGEVAHDGHPHAQNQDVGVLLQQALHHGLIQHSFFGNITGLISHGLTLTLSEKHSALALTWLGCIRHMTSLPSHGQPTAFRRHITCLLPHAFIWDMISDAIGSKCMNRDMQTAADGDHATMA